MKPIPEHLRTQIFDAAYDCVESINAARSNSVFGKVRCIEDGGRLIKVRVWIEEPEKTNGK